MSTYIFDIDGTLVKHHTNEWLPGAFEKLKELSINGDDIIFITRRSEIRDSNTEWSPERTKETILEDLYFENIDYQILFNVQSPRILIDDIKPKAIHHKKNSELET